MIQSPLLSSIAHIQHGFSMKDSSHIKNISIPKQVHGDGVITASSFKKREVSDALMTTNIRFPIGVYTADCVPILLADYKKSIVVAVHAGWRGTVKNIVSKAIDSMLISGSNLSSIYAAIGPSIKSCCYDISINRTEIFKNKFGSNTIKIIDNKNYIDLQEINHSQLIESGVIEKNIDIIAQCTKCNTEFYSYRRGDINKNMVNYITIV